ncbi:hypothetical protein H0H92_010128 [Tricholoma furcatifolium]|nr:hypothetical protein H0H92_010128 [Tricholoma furcatifolium]
MTTYSAFFSSGLLGPNQPSDSHFYDAPSPISPNAPLPDSDTEMDRDITPTPDTVRAASQPRLRKRRSSLTIGTSPMNAIRSPARTAGAALQLQMHLPNPSRSRSGSLSITGAAIANIASETTSLVGRMRSGSVSMGLRPRRGVRRLASVPAPAPPPTAPLPALPALLLAPVQSWFSAPHSAPLNGAFPKSFLSETCPPLAAHTVSDSVLPIKGRARGFSLSTGLTIDEETK